MSNVEFVDGAGESDDATALGRTGAAIGDTAPATPATPATPVPANRSGMRGVWFASGGVLAAAVALLLVLLNGQSAANTEAPRSPRQVDFSATGGAHSAPGKAVLPAAVTPTDVPAASASVGPAAAPGAAQTPPVAAASSAAHATRSPSPAATAANPPAAGQDAPPPQPTSSWYTQATEDPSAGWGISGTGQCDPSAPATQSPAPGVLPPCPSGGAAVGPSGG